MTRGDSSIGSQLADVLNRDCHCVAVNKEILRKSLAAHLRDSGLPDKLLDVHSHLFADSPVFLWQGHVDSMTELIHAVETVASNAAYRDAILDVAPQSARQDFGPRGVFFGYDFHLGGKGPQLIEINTNAGGVLLNVFLSAAQQACCSEVITFFGDQTEIAAAEADLVAMFQKEWRLQRPTEPLRTVAIVDHAPDRQFLYPEFLLFQSLFERHGIHAIIVDPSEFTIQEGVLWAGGFKIDLVYNRLTDFYFQAKESACLQEAYEKGMAVFTPSPYVYAMYADKRNLITLSDPIRLKELGIDDRTISTLSRSIPTTVLVTRDNAEQLWIDRRRNFFKPVTGFGSRGAYRGAKLTRRVWQEIVASEYVAQSIVPPNERQLIVNGRELSLKLDIRCVVYQGKIQQLSARLYRGQTTNLRTEGGGLATVFSTPRLSPAPNYQAESKIGD